MSSTETHQISLIYLYKYTCVCFNSVYGSVKNHQVKQWHLYYSLVLNNSTEDPFILRTHKVSLKRNGVSGLMKIRKNYLENFPLYGTHFLKL